MNPNDRPAIRRHDFPDYLLDVPNRVHTMTDVIPACRLAHGL